jgi:hypothetical protein
VDVGNWAARCRRMGSCPEPERGQRRPTGMACSPSRELVGPPVAAACQRALPLKEGVETRRARTR